MVQDLAENMIVLSFRICITSNNDKSITIRPPKRIPPLPQVFQPPCISDTYRLGHLWLPCLIFVHCMKSPDFIRRLQYGSKVTSHVQMLHLQFRCMCSEGSSAGQSGDCWQPLCLEQPLQAHPPVAPACACYELTLPWGREHWRERGVTCGFHALYPLMCMKSPGFIRPLQYGSKVSRPGLPAMAGAELYT